MENEKVISLLKDYSTRLMGEVVPAFEQRGYAFGRERFQAWCRGLREFLSQNLPGEDAILDKKLIHYGFSSIGGETDVQQFWRQDGENMRSYIDSMILDIQNGEYSLRNPAQAKESADNPSKVKKSNKRVFIVHGHDGEIKEKTARFIEKLGFIAIILSEQANQGSTIIEKIEQYTDVGFAIVLYTPDDKGNTESEADKGILNYRARQNVIFEHGFLCGKIGRGKVVTLVSDKLELPNDISGVVYLDNENWKIDIAKEMKAAGYSVDFNKVM